MAEMTDCLGRFVWHDMMTTDLDASLAFYQALFPEWTINELDMGDFTYPMIHVNGFDMGGFVALGDAPGVPSHCISYVAVEDCDATVAKFEAAGGACPVPAFDAPGVGRMAVVSDAQGAFIKPFQLAKPIELPQTAFDGQFCWNELMTSDIDAAKTVYADIFGWEFKDVDMGEMGTYTLFQVGDKDGAGGMNLPPGVEAPPHWLSYIYANDIDERTAKVESLGGAIHMPPTDIPNVGRFSVVADPTGSVFALYRGAADAPDC